MYDVIVVGGGVIGGLILRELSKYELKICMLEKESDVCMGSSKANSGIVHAGFDAAPGTLKAKFNVLGNEMMPAIAEELGVKYKNNGSLVVAFDDEQVSLLGELLKRGEQNGVKGLSIIDANELKRIEPNISENALAALYAPTGGIICPYGLTIAAIGNAMDNGAELFTDFGVDKIEKTAEGYNVYSGNKTVQGKVVINCAGLYSGKIAALVGDEFSVNARKGEYLLLDREFGDFVSHTLFFTPTKAGKGILVSQTVDGNILLGPTAEELETPNAETSADGIASVIKKAGEMCEKPPVFGVITSFAGIRAYSDRHDFIIEESKKSPGVIHCAGIESPGLTASPAIAKYVAEIVGGIIPLQAKKSFNGRREPENRFKELSLEEKNEIIKKDPSYGRIVCRCEQVTEGEILAAIRTNPPAKDVDGVKRRTRSGMGRCQGGFCQPHIAELLSKEWGIPMEEITKKGAGSNLLTGKVK